MGTPYKWTIPLFKLFTCTCTELLKVHNVKKNHLQEALVHYFLLAIHGKHSSPILVHASCEAAQPACSPSRRCHKLSRQLPTPNLLPWSERAAVWLVLNHQMIRSRSSPLEVFIFYVQTNEVFCLRPGDDCLQTHTDINMLLVTSLLTVRCRGKHDWTHTEYIHEYQHADSATTTSSKWAEKIYDLSAAWRLLLYLNNPWYI